MAFGGWEEGGGRKERMMSLLREEPLGEMQKGGDEQEMENEEEMEKETRDRREEL